jgi:hypothetical protein
MLGVTVGVDVMLGVQEGVGVGPVAVGNGPSSAWKVRAIAVRVLLDFAKSAIPGSDDWKSPIR